MTTDLLGPPYEQLELSFPPDYEGEVVATLVRRRADSPTRRAVLYLHGFVDYFFQTHLAEYYTSRGWDFYALDLRKYGRSIRPHQTPNFCRDVSEYFPEIDEAVRIIREDDGHDVLLVNGHSTGGLIAAVWAQRVQQTGVVQALFLNSPFFDFNEPWITRRGIAPLVSAIGKSQPNRQMPKGLASVYGLSIHRDYHGEWDYNLQWKPITGFGVKFGWLRAIRLAHRQVQAGLALRMPVLVACSAASYHGAKYSEAAQHADAVLNVNHIVRYSRGLGSNVTIVRIDKGKHDLVLSEKSARDQLFAELDRWLTAAVPAAA